MIRGFTFKDQMRMSDGVSTSRNVTEILLTEIPGAIGVDRADKESDRDGTDWWITCENGKRLSVDLKARETDWRKDHPNEDDLALEIWSVVETKKPGWTLDSSKKTDYVLWLWQDTGRWCLIPFSMLCAAFKANLREWCGRDKNKTSRFKRKRQRTDKFNGTSYHSECVFVDRKEIWRTIYKMFSGE